MSTYANDIFMTSEGRPRVLRGATIYSGATWLAELAGKVGFDAVWIEMEHGPASFEKIESLCLAAEAGGAIPTVRVPDHERHHILRSLEIGARILIVPMVNTAEQARQIVEYGKFPPIGNRGYNVRTRGVEYGLKGPKTAFAEANERTLLFAQIETREAVDYLDEICSIEALAGIFIGPGDLSVSLGCTGDLTCPQLVSVVTDCIRRARTKGKHAGILVSPGPLLTAAIGAGADLTFFAGDVMDLANVWPKVLTSVQIPTSTD